MIEQFRNYLLNEKNLQETSLPEYIRPVKLLLEKCPDFQSITKYEQVRALLLSFAAEHRWSKRTLYKYTMGTQEFFKFLTLFSHSEINPIPFIPFRKPPEPEPEFFDPKEIDQIIYDPHLSLRDMVIVRLLAETGIRRDECRNINIKDVDFRTRNILINGKGSRLRYVPFSRDALRLMKFYLVCTKKQGYTGEALFYGQVIGHGAGGRISRSALNKKMSRLSAKKGFRIHPHKFRHSVGGRMIGEQEAPETVVQKILGHANLNMTAKYTHYKPKQLQKFHDQFAKTL